MKYEFHVGDYVETKDGRVGYLTGISQYWSKSCNCWGINLIGKARKGETETEFNIDIAQSSIWRYFKRIGNIGECDSVKIKQSKEIERLPDDLPARFELPDGKSMILKTYTDSKDFVEASYSRELINKINELVNAVNELMEAENDKSIS